MEFNVPQGCSLICNITVTPQLPLDGVAQEWVMTQNGTGDIVDSLDVVFQKASSLAERQYERMVFIFNIAEAAQPDWRFTDDGIMYCDGKADYYNYVEAAVSSNGEVLTLTMKILQDGEESTKFTFLGIHRDSGSGGCNIYASADPGFNGRR